jgi:cytochrome c biogenesis protein CcmG/thiol:disulfide interchange protein DsbE
VVPDIDSLPDSAVDQPPPPPRGRGGILGRLVRPGRLSPTGKITYWGTIIALVVAAAVAVTTATSPATKSAAPPPLARSFSVPELGHPAATVSLAAYAGRPVIVNFFASWCTPCQRETPLLARFYASQHGRVVIVGIDANDQTAAAQRFTSKAGVSYPVGFDAFPSPVTVSYGVLALPQTFFLNARHHIVAKVMGAVTQRQLAKDVALMNQERG